MFSGKMSFQVRPFNQSCQSSPVGTTEGTPAMAEFHINPKRQRGQMRLPSLALRVAMACSLAMLGLAGCQAVVNPYDPRLEPPVPEAIAPGREMSKVALPAYRIEAPDVVSIEMLKLIPLPPYRADVFDVLQIRANATQDAPIDNYYIVEAEGTVNLGPQYGSVRVAGMTIDEIRTTLDKWLRTSSPTQLTDPSPSVQLARVAGAQPVTGTYLVGPDGTINLRQYGVVPIAGKTVTEARVAIEKHLQQFLDSPQAAVEVVAYNSKVYYVITQGAGLGDNVRRLPVTGNETVLDAVSQVGGLSQLASKKMWIARPRRTTSAASKSCPSIGTASPRRADGDELPTLAGRPAVHCRGRTDDVHEHRLEGDCADRAHRRHRLAGQLHPPQLPDPRPQLQPHEERIIARSDITYNNLDLNHAKPKTLLHYSPRLCRRADLPSVPNRGNRAELLGSAHLQLDRFLHDPAGNLRLQRYLVAAVADAIPAGGLRSARDRFHSHSHAAGNSDSAAAVGNGRRRVRSRPTADIRRRVAVAIIDARSDYRRHRLARFVGSRQSRRREFRGAVTGQPAQFSRSRRSAKAPRCQPRRRRRRYSVAIRQKALLARHDRARRRTDHAKSGR